jgi:hypothetical protein
MTKIIFVILILFALAVVVVVVANVVVGGLNLSNVDLKNIKISFKIKKNKQQHTFIVANNGNFPSPQNCPLKSSKSIDHIIAPANFLFAAYSH